MSNRNELQEFQEKVKEAILALDRKEVVQLAEKAVSKFMAPDLVTLIEKGFSEGLQIIGDKFGKGEMFLPELVLAAKAMKEAIGIIEPKLVEGQFMRQSLGKVVLATVKGDLHDIGKAIVGSLLTAKGFEVLDLGIDVPTNEIISSAEEFRADIIGVSALLTTTLPAQRELIEQLEKDGLRKKHKVMVGGAATSKDWARKIGADGHGADANEAVSLAIELSRNKGR
jgi:trimethylamine corrinoid protein